MFQVLQSRLLDITLQNNELMEAFRDRTIRIDIPYNTVLDHEVRIYEKDYNPEKIRGKHIAPHTIAMAAMWAVLTRLEDPKKHNLSLMQNFPMGSNNVFFRAEYTWMSEQFTDGDNDPLTFQDSFGILNLRVGVDIDDWNSTITLWGRNVLDERYYVGSFDPPLLVHVPSDLFCCGRELLGHREDLILVQLNPADLVGQLRRPGHEKRVTGHQKRTGVHVYVGRPMEIDLVRPGAPNSTSLVASRLNGRLLRRRELDQILSGRIEMVGKGRPPLIHAALAAVSVDLILVASQDAARGRVVTGDRPPARPTGEVSPENPVGTMKPGVVQETGWAEDVPVGTGLVGSERQRTDAGPARVQRGHIPALSIQAELLDTPTARKIWNILPLEGSVTVWGDEIYFDIPLNLAQEPDARAEVEVGDLAYWPAGPAFCIFFGPTPVSTGGQPRAYSPVNVFGKVLGDATQFKGVPSGAAVKVTVAE